jgi:biotin transport system substrate-specific component
MMRQTAVDETGQTGRERSIAAGSPRHFARRAGIAVASTALVALCAHISIPLGFTPVPITLQPFAVLLLGLLLSPEVSFAALTLYLLEGAAGLPVFSPHGPAGIAHLFGFTGGYLLAAPFAAAVAGLIYRDGRKKLLYALAGAAVGDAILLTIGALWLGAWTHAGLFVLLSQSVVPFLASDAAKVLAAAACAQIFASFSRSSFSTRSSQTE